MSPERGECRGKEGGSKNTKLLAFPKPLVEVAAVDGGGTDGAAAKLHLVVPERGGERRAGPGRTQQRR